MDFALQKDLPWKINFPDFANKPPFSAILHPYSEVRYVYQLTMGLCAHYKNSWHIYGTKAAKSLHIVSFTRGVIF